jgi:cytochrome c oxidase subunit 2
MMKLLILLVVVLGVVALAQLAKVYEHTRELRKTREEDISLADNKFNAFLWMAWMVVFFISSTYLVIKYGHTLPEAASEHGVLTDQLLDFNWIIVLFVFYLVNGLLFYFPWKYYMRKDRKATFLAHDNKLEIIWTIVPSLVLIVVIVYGLMTWNDVTSQPSGDYASGEYIKVEVTGEQWAWFVRYPGEDKVYGDVNVNAIDETVQNNLGIVTQDGMDVIFGQIEGEIHKIDSTMKADFNILPDNKVAEMQETIYKKARRKQRLKDLRPHEELGVNSWKAGEDDVVLFKKPLHLPVNVEVEFALRSKDVIHSVYMPHFRAQMNTVPGIPTRLKMTPTITTAEMREKLDDPEFDYILLCNKICGASHYNMWIPVIVETQADYDAWMAAQTPFIAPEEAPAVETVVADNEGLVAEESTNDNN